MQTNDDLYLFTSQLLSTAADGVDFSDELSFQHDDTQQAFIAEDFQYSSSGQVDSIQMFAEPASSPANFDHSSTTVRLMYTFSYLGGICTYYLQVVNLT